MAFIRKAQATNTGEGLIVIRQMIDYHVHTALCKHADGSMREYVESACRKGLDEICFLDHLTLHRGGAHLSMTPSELPFYFYSVRDLADQYKGRIAVKVGLEVDYDPAHMDDIRAALAPFAFDVIGGSVHFIGDTNLVSRYTGQDRAILGIDEISRRYLEKLEALIEADLADFICHMDIYKKFGQRPGPSLEPAIHRTLGKIAQKNIAVEINTSGWIHPVKTPYPDLNILAKCRELGIPVTFGSDAHTPADVGRSFETARNMLMSAGYDRLSAFYRRKRYDKKI